MNRIIAAAAITALLFITGCGSNGNSVPDDGPTYGTISITADEALQPVTETGISTFESIYKRAEVNAAYKPEGEAIDDLLNDSARVIIITRELNGSERAVFEKQKIIPRVTKIAYDAAALICNKSIDISLDSLTLSRLISGEISVWNQLKKGAGSASVKLVFDNNNSGTLRFVKEYAKAARLSPNSFALNSSSAVIDYVNKNKDAVGIIGLNWISDRDDSSASEFLNKINVIPINSYLPYQAYVAQKLYPLWRNVYMISREARSGLGTGFAAFMAAEKGQRIVLKSGLVPAAMPVRIVEITNENIE